MTSCRPRFFLFAVPVLLTILWSVFSGSSVSAGQNNWRYDAPTAESLTVVYPSWVGINPGNANHVNIQLRNPETGASTTLNYHTSGTFYPQTTFVFENHSNFPSSWDQHCVTWVQVAESNYHWTGSVCSTTPPPTTSSTTPSTTSSTTTTTTPEPLTATLSLSTDCDAGVEHSAENLNSVKIGYTLKVNGQEFLSLEMNPHAGAGGTLPASSLAVDDLVSLTLSDLSTGEVIAVDSVVYGEDCPPPSTTTTSTPTTTPPPPPSTDPTTTTSTPTTTPPPPSTDPTTTTSTPTTSSSTPPPPPPPPPPPSTDPTTTTSTPTTSSSTPPPPLVTEEGISLSLSCESPAFWEVTNVYNGDLSYHILVNGVSFVEGFLSISEDSASGEISYEALTSASVGAQSSVPNVDLAAELFVDGQMVDERTASLDRPCLPTTPPEPPTSTTVPCPMQPCLPITGGVSIPIAWLAGLAGFGFFLIFVARRRKEDEEAAEKFSTDFHKNGF